MVVLCFMYPPPLATSLLSLHDALPICALAPFLTEAPLQVRLMTARELGQFGGVDAAPKELHAALKSPANAGKHEAAVDRKSTRLNSSHRRNSYPVFCLKKKNIITQSIS